MGTKMYFIQEGVVDVISKENEILTSLSDGSYFGGKLWGEMTDTVCVMYVEYCIVWSYFQMRLTRFHG